MTRICARVMVRFFCFIRKPGHIINMADPRLIDYVKRYLNAGYSVDQIERNLLDVGWNMREIDEAIIQARTQVPAPMHGAPVYTTSIPRAEPERRPPEQPAGQQAASTEYKPMGVFTKFKMVLIHPGRFFNAVKPEKGYESPVKYYLFLLFIQIVIANAILYLSLTLGAAFFDPSLINPLMGLFTLTTVNNFLFANITLVLSVIVLFIMAGIMNVFLKALGGRAGMPDTFKGIVYAYTPNVILTIISVPIYLLMFQMSPIFGSSGVNITSGFDPSALTAYMENIFSIITIMEILSVIFLVWGLYLELKGLSTFHEISMFRVFGAIILTGVVLYLISFALLFGLLFLVPFAIP
jgi:hypothetical protein